MTTSRCGSAASHCVAHSATQKDLRHNPLHNSNTRPTSTATHQQRRAMSHDRTPHTLDARYEHLTISILTEIPHVTVVSLSRPRKRNAINSKVCPGSNGRVAKIVIAFIPPNFSSVHVIRCGGKSETSLACWGRKEMVAGAFC